MPRPPRRVLLSACVAGALATAIGIGARLAAVGPGVHLTSIGSYDQKNPAGIDYYAPSDQLVVSVGYNIYPPLANDLELVSTSGSEAAFSTLGGLFPLETKVATVRCDAVSGGFMVGDTFATGQHWGEIIRVPRGVGDATDPAIVPWVVLPVPPHSVTVRGGMFQDRYGVFGGDLIAVTGNQQDPGQSAAFNTAGNVWRVTSAGVTTQLADINRHLEGPTTVPNDPAKYGPIAGCILAGDEDRLFTPFDMNGPDGAIWAICPQVPGSGAPPYSVFSIGNGAGATYHTNLPINPQDLDVIPAGADLYLTAIKPHPSWIFKAPAADFDAFAGDILVTEELPGINGASPSGLSVLHWNAALSQFEVTQLDVAVDPFQPAPERLGSSTFGGLNDCPHPSISLIKRTNTKDANDPNGTDVPNIASGGAVTWTYEVKNTGSSPINGNQIVVSDDQTGVTPTYFSGDNGDNILSPNEVWTYRATGTAVDLAHPPLGVLIQPDSCRHGNTERVRTAYVNTGTVTVVTNPGAWAADTSSYCNPQPPIPELILTKNAVCSQGSSATPCAGTTYSAVNQVITYTYVLKNTGTVTLPGPFSVSDNKQGTIAPCGSGPLAVGATMLCTSPHTITQADLTAGSITNLATATTTYNGQPVTSNQAQAIVNAARITLVKTAACSQDSSSTSCSGTNYSSVNQVITYTYTITNAGTVMLPGPFSVTDNKQGTIAPCGGPLAPGGTTNCTSPHTITQADLNAGSITNTATATTSYDGQPVTSNQAQATVNAIRTPAISLVKSAACSQGTSSKACSGTIYSAVNQKITYTYVIKNVGNVTLPGPFSVSDNKQGTIAPCGSGPLAPSATTSCTSVRTISQADITAGSIVNLATATTTYNSQAVTSNQATATVTAAVLALTKNAGPVVYSSVGQVITYSYVVTNTGPTTLPGPVTVTDNKAASVSCPALTTVGNLNSVFETGESVTCSATYSITQADLNAGTVTNLATARAGGVDSNQATATVRKLVPGYQPPPGQCYIGYPYTDPNQPRASVAFNESEVLRAFGHAVTATTDTVNLFYNDEHALTLGVRQVAVNTGSTTTTGYPIAMMGSSNPSTTSGNPVAVGTTAWDGDQAGTDANSCAGFPDLCDRPMFPSLFVTDITNAPDNAAHTSAAHRAGDWHGGSPLAPNAIFGSWKAAVRTVKKTVTPNLVTVTPDADPSRNNWNLGPGSDPAPVSFSSLTNEGYGAEARWNVSDLKLNGQPLVAGRIYRLQVIVHDGDQNKTGGDVGQACLIITR